MASVEFHNVPKDQLDSMPDQAYRFLDDACYFMKDYMSVDEAIAGVHAGIGNVFMVFADNVLSGCMYINFRLERVGKTMNLILLGGKNFDSWFKDLQFFLNRLALDNNVNEFTILGRKGWERKIPDMDYVGCMLRKKIKALN